MQLQHRRLPQRRVVPPQVHLRFGEAVGIRQHLRREFEERLGRGRIRRLPASARCRLARERNRRAAWRSCPRRWRGIRRARRDRSCGVSGAGHVSAADIRSPSMVRWSLARVSGARSGSLPSTPTTSRTRPRMPEVVEVGDRLAHREKALLQVELAAEQHRHEIGRRATGVAPRPRLELRQPRRVVRAQLRDARTRCRETAGRATAAPAYRAEAPRSAVERIEEARQRIAVGLDRPDADVGADSAAAACRRRCSTLSACAVERSVLGRVAVARDHPPAVAADRDIVAVRRSRWNAAGQLGHAAPVLVAARRQRRDMLGASSRARGTASQCRADAVARRARSAIACAVRNSACVIATGQSKRCRQPRGVAEVIGMVVRRDDARERPSRRASSRSATPTARASRASP